MYHGFITKLKCMTTAKLKDLPIKRNTEGKISGKKT
jgi:hypothetical protein